MNPILAGLRGLGPARLLALGLVAIGMMAMMAMLALHGGNSGRMALLYGDLDLHEASEMTDALDRSHIDHAEDAGGGRILVGTADVARARLLLAKDGLPSGGSIGYEIFDRGDAMTASSFQQEINQTRALEGEIARSIRLLQGVRGARVHLVLPKREPFSRESQAAQASVILTMAGAARLDPQAVQAVLYLVAAAVPGLKPQAIALIDSHGNLLARAGQPTGDDGAGGLQSGEEIRHGTEVRLARAVEDMLEQSLGPGHVRAEAAVQMNFDHVNETTENYNPDQQVVRSTQSVTDSSHSTDAQKATTVQNNLPNADAGETPSGSQDQRQEETTNYEIGKTVRTLVQEQPQIARISLAVMVDGLMQPGTDGKLAWGPLNPSEIARLKSLVQSAIGFDEKRGDKVEVMSMRFVQEDDAASPVGSGLLGFDKADLMSLAQSAIPAMVVLLALMFVLRPMALRLSAAAATRGFITADGTLLEGPEAEAMASLAGGGRALAVAGAGPAMLADESMVNIANIEGQMRASSMRGLVELVEKHPEESLAIIRSWMSRDRA